MAAAAARRLLSHHGSWSSLSALLYRGAVPEQSLLLLRPAVFAAASRLGFPRRHGDGAAVPQVRLRALAHRDGQARREGTNKQQMIDSYIQILPKVLGRYVRRVIHPPAEAPSSYSPCEDEAKKNIYSKQIDSKKLKGYSVPLAMLSSC